MTLGILVNTDRHRDHVIGIAQAATAKKHSVIIFVMDRGTRLLADAGFAGLTGTEGISMSFCTHSARMFQVGIDALPEKITAGSQLLNAAMQQAADRVLVL